MNEVTLKGTNKSQLRRPTIRDVAKETGVSVGTVSLALSDHPAVAETTKARVREVAQRLNYSPSAVGRALQSQRANAVGLVVPHSDQHVFSHLYFMEVLSGVSQVLNQADMTMVLSTSSSESDEDAAYLKIIQSQQVDGIVLASAALHDDNILRLKKSGRPFVFIGRYPLDTSIPAVGISDKEGAIEATRHLIAHGHHKIAHISGPLPHLSAIDRLAGYREALQAARLPVEDTYLYEGDYSEEAGRQGMQTLLALPDPPTALFAANDETAIGAIAVLREAHIEPGRAFPIVGFDDVILARHITPSLTTIRQPMRELGRQAAQQVVNLIQGHSLERLQTQLATELVVRQSCGCE